MSKRTGEWHLFGHDSDPVPGDWEDIQSAATHLSSVAETIADQVTRLRQLEDDDQILKGEYADGLRESCGDLADDLDRVQGRFEQVGSELNGWWEPVQTARTKTWNALQDAEAAKQVIDANPAPDRPPLGSPPPTDAEKDAEDVRSGKVDGASDDLDQAKTDFDSAMSTYDDKADSVANAIKDASDDDMKDSRWDKFKGWVDANAGWLKTLADVISVIVTIVAIVALFCTPVGWVMLAVAALAVLGLAIRAALAASGNGSWTDFAIDLVGVLTLGTGRIAAAFAKGARMATLRAVGTRAGRMAQANAVRTAREAFRNARWLDKPMVWLTRSNPISRWIAGRTAYTTTKLSWITKKLPDVTKIEKVLAGMDDTGAAMMKEINALKTTFPDLVSPGYRHAVDVAVNAGRTGAITDGVDKLLGGPGFGPLGGFDFYNDAKDHFTYAPGNHLW